MGDETEARWQKMKSAYAKMDNKDSHAAGEVGFYSINWDGAGIVDGQRALAKLLNMSVTSDTKHHTHAASGVKTKFTEASAAKLDHLYQSFMGFDVGRHQPFYDQRVGR